jgi:hypothetical protein
MQRQFAIVLDKDKAKTRLMNEFLEFCHLMNYFDKGLTCLSSPTVLKTLLGQFATVDKAERPDATNKSGEKKPENSVNC